MTLIVLLLPAMTSSAADSAPRIVHEPVTAGIKGQPVYIRATVTDDGGPAKAVNLYCSVSSDSAPFKVKMRASGASAFIGTLPDNLVRNSATVSYYIEAVDSLEQATETPWYTIRFRAASGKATRTNLPKNDKSSSWKKPILIVGGTVAAIAVGVSLSDSGGSSDDSTTTPPSADGLFSGEATRFYTPEGAATIPLTYPVNFNVLNENTLTSDDIHYEGGHMDVTLTAGSFTWYVPASGAGETGGISYSGTLAGDTIQGRISGQLTTSSGTNATYDGFFTAKRP